MRFCPSNAEIKQMTQSETVQPKIYWCGRCEAETLTTNPICPKYGGKMERQSQNKSYGQIAFVLVIFITLAVGLVFFGVAAVVLFVEKNADETATTFAALSAVGGFLLAGITIFFYGRRLAKTGRTSRKFMWLIYGLIVLILILGRIFSFLKG